MKISQAASYGITASAQLSDNPLAPPIPCSVLCKCGDMPERFLLQVLRDLVNEGVLQSTRGVDGGYRLARPATQITLDQIVEAIDGPLDVDRQETLPGVDKASNKLIVDALNGATGDLRRRLKGITLAQVKPAAKPAAKQLAGAR